MKTLLKNVLAIIAFAAIFPLLVSIFSNGSESESSGPTIAQAKPKSEAEQEFENRIGLAATSISILCSDAGSDPYIFAKNALGLDSLSSENQKFVVTALGATFVERKGSDFAFSCEEKVMIRLLDDVGL